jgi:hypothetical protein
LRVSSFAEANGHLYAAVGQQVFERVDGPAPSWRLIYTNPDPGHSETGLRGLTVVNDEAGPDALLAAVEGSVARLVRIDPTTGAERTELNLRQFLSNAWGMPVGYIIAAYNDMAPSRLPGVGNALFIGLMAFVQRGAPASPGHSLVDVGYGQVERDAWYLIRRQGGSYDLRRVNLSSATPLVATRSIRLSPFLADRGIVYFAGFDANKSPAHDTAWIARANLDGQ